MNWDLMAKVDTDSIEECLKNFKVDAKVDSENIRVFAEAFTYYPISRGPKTAHNAVLSKEKELLEAIANGRKKNDLSFENLSIRFHVSPFLIMEVNNPPGFKITKPEKRVPDYQALIGVSYKFDGREDFYFDLNKHHQTLIAALSGHGKSYLVEQILEGLYNTPPSKIIFNVIDYKNSLKVNRNIVKDYISEIEDTEDFLNFIKCDVELRKANSILTKRKRVVIIDEGAELPKQVDEKLGSIMKRGRSLGVNVIIATQHPTAKQIGQIIAQSFTHRFIGRVSNANNALWATGIEKSGAEKLLTKGSFLYCEGHSTRIQVFSNG